MLLALALTWGLGSIVVLTVGNHFAALAFDRALLDDAYALAAHVRIDGGRVHLDMSPREASILRFDQSESILFAVFGSDGRFVDGDAGLPAGEIEAGASHAFSTRSMGDQELRHVSLRLEGDTPYSVAVAQTTAGRKAFLRRLMAYCAIVQLWLLVVLASWLPHAIERDLRPLGELQDAVDQRDAAGLEPLPAALTRQAGTRDVQRLGEAVNALLARLQRSLHAQREFAGTVAHELRTPLAGIRAQAAHALAQDDPTAWRSELEGIARAEARASRLVDQLLALARAAESSAALTLEPVALDSLLRDLLLRFLPRADALGVDLGAEGLDEAPAVQGDRALIEGILGNLLDNALRYGRGPVPRVTLSVAREPDAAVLCVTDNGPGLADDATALAMPSRWAQGAQGRRLGEGAGLGLAIVARYVELLQGRFSLHQAPGGHGLCVSVWLPLAPVAD